MKTPKTIQIFLPGGDPRGIRSADITTRIVQVFDIPRSLLNDFLQMPESDQVAVYLLFGQSEDGGADKVYIGQSGDLRKRLVTHNKEKGFWQRVVVIISRTHSLTQTHALFLEWFCIQQAKEVGRYLTDENKNGGSKPHTPAPLEADCLEIFDTSRTLLSTLGYPVFDPIVGNAPEADELFFCKRSGTNAAGRYTPEGFVVLKGSTGKPAVAKSFEGHAFAKKREELINLGKAAVENNVLVFKADVLFSSPSGASAAVCGAASNGWADWKDKAGNTLDSIKRQSKLGD